MEILGGNQHAHNVRYQVAKGQIDQLFVKWISQSTTDKLITKLLQDLETNQASTTLTAPPSPLFITKMQKQPGSPTQKGLTPPRSPSGDKYGLGRTMSPKQSSSLLDQFRPMPQKEPEASNPYNSKFAMTDASAMKGILNGQGDHFAELKSGSSQFQSKLTGSPYGTESEKAKQSSPRSPVGRTDKRIKNQKYNEEAKQENKQSMIVTEGSASSVQKFPSKQNIAKKDEKPKEIVAPFYFPLGKPLSREDKANTEAAIEKAFDGKPDITEDKFDAVTTEVCKVPKIFRRMLFEYIIKDQKLEEKTTKITKQTLISFYKKQFEMEVVGKRVFKIVAQKDNGKSIMADDFKPLFKFLLETHPGLEFLQATPEFQERYADTVVMRVFFMLDSNDDGKITWRDFKQSNLLDTFFQVSNENDINVVRQYFSYEHFYVLYCRFWELDNDHDFLIDKEDFSRYEGHALSRKAVDRIFDQVPRKFKSETKDKMNYEDFVWLMLSEEDKTTLRSINYWFKVIDLDDNQIITPHEMEYFYEEQVHRLEYLNHEPILFVDLLCQMNDLVKPKVTEGHFYLDELKLLGHGIGIFFNCLVNLNKFIAYETRDLFSLKHQLTEFPDYSEWDRFAKTEYERLAMEEEQGEDSEVLDAMDGWDSEEETGATSANPSAATAAGEASET